MPVRPKEGARCPAAGVIGSCEQPNKGAGKNPSLVQKEQALWTNEAISPAQEMISN